MNCKQCGKPIIEDTTNPAIHYSTPSEICMHCEIKNNKKRGEWYQDRNGEYRQKK